MENEVQLNLDIDSYSYEKDLYGKQAIPTVKPGKNIGIDVDNEFVGKLIDSGTSSQIDMSKIESFTQISSNREQIMEVLDTMAEDSRIAAVLEMYAEDATELNDEGNIVWCVSKDPEISKYITFLLKSINVDKYIYKWVYALCKYGDVYLRLYRESEFYDDGLFDKKDKDKEKESLNEDIIVKMYSKKDRYSHYIEMVPNPAEMFELTRFGKSYAYIKADINAKVKTSNMINAGTYRYSFRKNDIELYDPTNFAHAILEDTTSRIPEEVELFLDDNSLQEGTGIRYTVKRGQSLLFNVFKIWRETCLLENSLLLNRLTKSSIVRVIGVEVGDMPKENVGPHLSRIKQLVEQKSSLDVGTSLNEYTNPGPIENNIYVPTRNGQGTLNMSQIGGDVDVKGIADIDYFKNLLWASLRVPKQFLGDTDDAAGFSGGQSLALISSRYAKAVKRIQSSMIQALTDVINLMLLDKGLDRYINNFELKMQSPMTQEEKDRIESEGMKISKIQDIMNLVDGIDIPNASSKLKILKILLSNTISDDQVLAILDDEIENMEEIEESQNEENDNDDDSFDDFGGIGPSGNDYGSNDLDININDSGLDDFDTTEMEPESDTGDETILPMPDELGIGDLTDLNNENI